MKYPIVSQEAGTMKYPKRVFGVAVVSVAVAVVVAACGSSTSSTSSSGGSTASASGSHVTAPTGAPIKLGVITPLTDLGPQFPEIGPAAEAAAKAINDAGGVKDPAGGPNRPISIVVCDDASPAANAACGRQMVSDHVIAMVGNQANDDGYVPITSAAGIPSIGGSTSTAAELMSPLNFAMNGGVLTTDIALVVEAHRLGLKKISLEYIGIAAAAGGNQIMVAKAKALGMDVVNNVAIPPTAVDFSSFAAQLTGNGSQGVLLLDSSPRAALILKSVNQTTGVTFDKFRVVTTLEAKDLATLGSVGNGITGLATVWPLSDASNAGIAQFKKEYAQISGAPTAGAFGVRAWAAVHLLAADAFPKMSKLDAATLVKTLPTLGLIKLAEITPFNWAAPIDLGLGTKFYAYSGSFVVSTAENGVYTPGAAGFVKLLP
jgi:ABC-type branched-subunit amino acid transport system substrate-binding protein